MKVIPPDQLDIVVEDIRDAIEKAFDIPTESITAQEQNELIERRLDLFFAKAKVALLASLQRAQAPRVVRPS